MDFTAFNERMITDDGIRKYGVDDDILGYEFMLRYPTYRGTWVCNIEKLAVKVDGVPIADEDMRFGVNGKWFLMHEMNELFREYWFTTTKAKIRVMRDGGLSAGSTHEISVHMEHRIPYVGYFGTYLVVHSDCTKQLCVEKER
jgi:hypothetical protein